MGDVPARQRRKVAAPARPLEPVTWPTPRGVRVAPPPERPPAATLPGRGLTANVSTSAARVWSPAELATGCAAEPAGTSNCIISAGTLAPGGGGGAAAGGVRKGLGAPLSPGTAAPAVGVEAAGAATPAAGVEVAGPSPAAVTNSMGFGAAPPARRAPIGLRPAIHSATMCAICLLSS